MNFRIHRYYHGPTPIQSQQYATSQDIINSLYSIRQEMEAYVPKLTQVGYMFSFAQENLSTQGGVKYECPYS